MHDQKNVGELPATPVGDTAAAVNEVVSDATSGAKEQLAGVGRKVTEKLEEATSYFRNADVNEMVEDVQGVVKRYPGAAVAAALVLGFLLAHAVQRRN